MAKRTSVEIDWADGTYTFKLPIAQLEEHDELCGAGPLVVLTRISDGTWRVPFIRETIRLGLIGAGMPAADALKLTRRYVDVVPLIQSVPIAMVILAAALKGEDVEPQPVGKFEAVQPESEPEPTDLTSPPFVEAPSPSAFEPPTSAP